MLGRHLRPLVYITPAVFSLNLVPKASLCSPSNPPSLDVTIYQYKICPFCCRTKVVLDFIGVHYKTVEVNPLTKEQLSFSKEYKKVPVANIDGEITAGSGEILSKVHSILGSHGGKKSNIDDIFPPNSEYWIEWSEKKLAVMLYPNITRNFNEAWESFEYAGSVPTWSPIQRYANRYLGPVAMYLANGKIKKKYGIVDERAELKDVLDVWINAVGDKKFLNGNQPTVPDLVVYGVLHSIEGMKTFEFAMENEKLKKWYDSVRVLIPNNSS